MLQVYKAWELEPRVASGSMTLVQCVNVTLCGGLIALLFSTICPDSFTIQAVAVVAILGLGMESCLACGICR